MSEMDLDQILNDVEARERGHRGKRRGKRPSYDNPLDGVSAKKTARAINDTTMAGEEKRKTIYLPPAMIEQLDNLAAQEGVSIKDFYRWLLEVGYEAYLAGDRPVAQVVRTKAKIEQREW